MRGRAPIYLGNPEQNQGQLYEAVVMAREDSHSQLVSIITQHKHGEFCER